MQQRLDVAVHPNQAFVEAALEWLHEPTTTMQQALAFYETLYTTEGCDDWVLAELGRGDRFFLGVHLCGRADLADPWLYARCREVEADPDGNLDLWAREHYKSTIITFLGVIQEVLNDPEITICIFSHTGGIAKKFLIQIKQELEKNERLKRLYSEILYANPSKESPKWTEEALTVKRVNNPKERTVECSGLVDGMPTGAHFMLRVYDDVVVPASIGTPEQVEKTSDAFDLSDNLGARGPDGISRKWGIGTRYAFFDTYSTILQRGVLKARIYAATDNGLPGGKPVFLSAAAWAQKKIDQPSKILACQMLQNPAAGNEAMFKREWLSFQDVRPATLNVYIMGDPANSKKKGSDNTAIAVIGIDSGNNKYLLDGYRHKMSLRERWEALAGLRKVWTSKPGVQMVKVGWEKYGMQADMDYFDEQMLLTKDAFEIHELNWVKEGTQSKVDRIQRLEPDFRAKKFHMAMVCVRKIPLLDASGNEVRDGKGDPVLVDSPFETANQKRVRESGQTFRIFSPVRRRDHEGNIYSLNKGLLDEFLVFPFSAHDDLLDACSRIYDMEPVSPIAIDQRALEPEIFTDGA